MKRDLFMVIDMQNVYAEGGEWFCPSIDIATNNIISVLQEAKENNAIDVIFTKFIASKSPVGTWVTYNEDYKSVNTNEYANEMIDGLKPYATDYEVYEKSEYSSLSVQDIRNLVSSYIEDGRVVVSGVVAECCVLATVMELIDMGVKVVYLTDAVAGIDDSTQQAVLKILEGLDPLHVRRMTTEEYLNENR